jgi:hypothetical protein
MALVTAPVSRKSLICSATCSATFSCASLVAGAEMRRADHVFQPNSGLSLAGSVSNTSSAAPATWPDDRVGQAASSIRPPRAQLMMRTPFLVFASASRERILRVASVSGVCSVMKSARASNSSSSAFSTPSPARAFPTGTDRRRSPACAGRRARSATMEPILPAPIRPSVLPVSSTPMKRFFSHLPALVEAVASGICAPGEHHGDGMFGGGDGVAVRRVHHHHAARGGGFQIDIVHADAGAADHFQVGGDVEQLPSSPWWRSGWPGHRRRR